MINPQKKILILSNRIDDDLYNAIQKHSKNNVFSSSYRYLNFSLEKGKVDIFDRANGLYLNQYDLVYFKQYQDITKACTIFLEENRIPFINRDIGKNFVFNKLAQYVKLALGNYPIPKTFYGSHKALKEMASGLKYPIILKSINSSLGQDNFLIKDEDELSKTLDLNSKVPFVLQEFIANNYDYRVLILGGELGTVLQRIRQNKSDHRNNTALGAKEVEITSPDRAMVDLSIDIAKYLDKDVAGIDLIFDEITKRYYIIEINSKPSFTYDTRISSEVPAFAKFIDLFVGNQSTSK